MTLLLRVITMTLLPWGGGGGGRLSLPWHRYQYTVTMTPLPERCYHFTDAMTPLPGQLYHDTATMTPFSWHRSHTTVSMISWPCNRFDCYSGHFSVTLLPWLPWQESRRRMTLSSSKVSHMTGRLMLDMEQYTDLFNCLSPWGRGCLNSVLAARLFVVSFF